MTVSPAERQYILSQVNALASKQIVLLWSYAEALPDVDFAAFVKRAFPDVVTPFAATAADLATAWYDESPSPTSYLAKPGALPDVNALEASASWALATTGREAIGRMQGTAQRAIFDSARDTTMLNADTERGAKYARHASANACAFCALMSSRGAVYASKASATRVVGRGKAISLNFNADGTRKSGGQAKGVKVRGSRQVGDKWHDNCHCVYVEVRPGGSYHPPPYVKNWERAYKDAFAAVPDGMAYGTDNAVLKAVLSNMRSDLGSH